MMARTKRMRQAAHGFAAFAMLAAAQAGHAQSGPQAGAQAIGRAEAEVIVPIRAVPVSDLSFGLIVVGTAGDGTVEVAPDGSPPRYTSAARSTCSGEAGCAAHPARFDVAGEPRRSYRIVLPDQIRARGTRTGASLAVVAIRVRSVNAGTALAEGVLDEAGQDSFFVGGTLQVPAGTRPDVFRADLPVIVTYN